MSELFGIDVSRCQKDIDWSKVKKDFVIIKITNKGNVVEDKFEQNYAGCIKNNILVGGYKYVYATTIAEAKAEAEGMLKVLNGRKLPYGIWIDMEDKTIKTIGKQLLTDIIVTEAKILQASGYDVGIYCNYDWYKNVLDSKTLAQKYPFWVARYKKPDTGVYDANWSNNPKSYAQSWQYSSKGKVDGIVGNVDMDVLFYPISTVFGKDVSGNENKEANSMAVIFGSARCDERGKLTGGAVGDQTGKEVSTQNFYMHSKGWYALRAINDELANKLAEGMKIACANNNIGYDQSNRLGAYKYGIDTKVKTECDCSGLVRAILKWAGYDVVNFTTANEKSVLLKTGLFSCVEIKSASECYTGDILVTKTKGHTGIIVSGKQRSGSSSVCPYTEPILTVTSAKQAKLKKITKYSCKGNDAGWVQWHLKRLGYDLGPDGVDEDFGATSVNALMKFQKDYKLTIDGLCGEKSRKKLKAV
jgi:GH25 family lysozyme M1 (1,4-beta-N-acetylmuramidase)